MLKRCWKVVAKNRTDNSQVKTIILLEVNLNIFKSINRKA